MAHGEVVVRFEKVTFEYGHNKTILDAVDFSIRRGMKVTIMGQNGAGKSTLFSLITGMNEPEDGQIHLAQRTTIAIARQVIPRDELDLTVREFFSKCFKEKVYDIDPRIDEVLEVVNLKGHEKVHDRIVRSFSGGQQARILLASALIQNPDILLLDEPTNNLDKAGIAHLTDFLVKYKKTVIVISHDSHFLNSFTDAVLYLDVYTRKIEQYVGNYTDVRDQIAVRMERENRKNALLSKEIQAKKDQANAFAMKGGNLRAVAKRMRELAEDLEEEKVDVRKEDKTIRPFKIPFQGDLIGDIITFESVSILKNHKPKQVKVNVKLRKNKHLLLAGPNGIGKSTLLEALANNRAEGVTIAPGVNIGYYRQDFSTLNFEHTVFEALADVSRKYAGRVDEERIRATAASFLITGDMVNTRIGSLSEGQKGLVAFASLVIERPGLLILDEPTNHINFRHLPVIAKALDEYEGAMILVSHVPEFVDQIRIDEILDLDKH
ncbi:MAG: ABC-F family ATP-binding cassette domain-containing protein [Candidatus Pacebacteria bacterium]|nr:ABC-F family ATP-binding cassette domain-containing protein [Candidatus Paceibacterota bacterium]MBP9715682.1 ABC-F family ATP-binding cassette domain-containing protein [Candidatus Paceibacterota bacterium]